MGPVVDREKWESYDRSKRMLAMSFCPGESERVGDGICIGADIYARLEGLKAPPGLMKTLHALYETKAEPFEQLEQFLTAYCEKARPHISRKAREGIKQVEEVLGTATDDLHEIWSDIWSVFDKILLRKLAGDVVDLKEPLDSAEDLLRKYNAIHFSSQVRDAERSRSKYVAEIARFHADKRQEILSAYEKTVKKQEMDDSLRREYLGAKIARTWELANVDKALGQALGRFYLAYTPLLIVLSDMSYDRVCDVIKNPGTTIVDIDGNNFRDFVEIDNDWYEKILDYCLRPKQEPRTVVIEQPMPESPLPLPTVLRQIEEMRERKRGERSARLKQAILNGRADTLHADSQKRVEYFIGDVLGKGCTDKDFENLCEAFEGMNFGSRIRNRNTTPRTEEKLTAFRTFFDDVYLGMLKGKVPTASEMKTLYNGAKSS